MKPLCAAAGGRLSRVVHRQLHSTPRHWSAPGRRPCCSQLLRKTCRSFANCACHAGQRPTRNAAQSTPVEQRAGLWTSATGPQQMLRIVSPVARRQVAQNCWSRGSRANTELHAPAKLRSGHTNRKVCAVDYSCQLTVHVRLACTKWRLRGCHRMFDDLLLDDRTMPHTTMHASIWSVAGPTGSASCDDPSALSHPAV